MTFGKVLDLWWVYLYLLDGVTKQLVPGDHHVVRSIGRKSRLEPTLCGHVFCIMLHSFEGCLIL